MDEISPSHLREGVEFSVKLRGYDPEQVDDFLDRVAGGIELLQQQLRQALERAARAEQQAAENAETDRALRRTLLLAQKTADELTAEADAYAARVRSEADAQAEAILAEAREAAAREAIAAQQSLRDDIRRLETARTLLEADIDALGRFVEAERARLRSVLEEQLERLGSLTVERRPPSHEVALPPIPAVPEPAAADAGGEPEPEPDGAAEADAAAAGPEHDAEAETAGVAGEEAAPDGAAVEAEASGASGEPGRPAPRDVFAPAGDEGEPTAAHDPFLDELRKATVDDEPLGPRDDDRDDLFAGFEPLDGETDLGLDRSRWGRRRRR